MADSEKNSAVARQVELVIRKLDSLSTLPQVAACFLSTLAAERLDRNAIAEIIESDAALTARILSLAHQHGATFTDGKPSIAEAVAKLPEQMIRDAVLSVGVFQAFDANYDPDSKRVLPRKQLALHALATACCAASIAEIALDPGRSQSAFSAGLLHDIGKLAIDEVMPKSFEKIIEEAKAQNASMCRIERKHLSLDHTVVGKRLAEKWQLPAEIVYAIWLHHSDTEAIAADMPAGRLVHIVRLADIIARQCNIGMSGSFDTPDSISPLLDALSLSQEQIDKIRDGLFAEVSRRSEVLGLEAPAAAATYSELISKTAATLAHQNSVLSTTNRKLLADTAQMNFINEFLPGVTSNLSAIDIAAKFAAAWQRHYQTGPLCLYLQTASNEDLLELVTIDKNGGVNTQLINAPKDRPPVPQQLNDKFAIINVGDQADWLFEQIDLDIDLSRAKLTPLPAGGGAIGAIIFEQRLPVDAAESQSLFEPCAAAAATVLNMASAANSQSRLAEQFARLMGKLKDMRDELTAAKLLDGLAEMAAGAAHELNNPLAVISGRAQMLYEAETDADKKKMLNQLQQRTEEISQIVTDLMNFARPSPPQPETTELRKLLDSAVKKTAKAAKIKKMEVEFDSIDEMGEVYVDPEQIITALTNILSNALESYDEGFGTVRISGKCPQTEDFAAFEIADNGCGMDAATVAKAGQPFFSARPAGRKRGMGLAHAQRLTQVNNGSICLISQLSQGTTVTINLPRK
jgi:putative nucleotidyltransferase with HDIG domain